jgi:trigger factor
VPVPDQVVADELQARRESIQQQLSFAGMTMEQYLDNEGQTQDEFDADLERQVRDAVATQFVLDQLAREREIQPDQQELSEHMMRRAQQSGQNPQEFMQHALEHNHLPELIAEVVRGKALAAIVESATVTDGSGTVVNLANLRGDGTLGDPEAEASDTSETPETPETTETGEGQDEES